MNELSSEFQKFAFPLNVYAYAIALEEGQVDYLHYGLFADPAERLLAAQLRSCDLLLERLPPPPCRILEVGIGLGTMLSRLMALGYDVTGITPDAMQISIARQKSAAKLICSRLEDYKDEPASFDLVLFQESSQYIDPLTIFNQALDLLVLGGQLFILDEVLLKAVEYGGEGLHARAVMLDLAARFGFELCEDIDLSQAAYPTLGYLLGVVDKHRSALKDDLGCTDEQLDALNESNRRYRDKYASGRYGYALQCFRKTNLPRWRLDWGGPALRPQILALFEQVFAHSMPPALWDWKYCDGRGASIVARHDGRVVAHYGGLARSVLFFGEPRTVVQIGDVMVHPTERGILTKQSGFARIAATFFDLSVGYGTDSLASFGFPNARAMRLGATLGLYDELDKILEVSWPVSPAGRSLRYKLRRLDNGAEAAHLVETVWQRMRADLRGAVVGVRDWAYLQYRYVNHPTLHYELLAVTRRLGQQPLGVLVVRHDGEHWELMDVIGALRDLPALIHHGRRWAGSHGGKQLRAWICSAWQPQFAGHAATFADIEVSVASSICRAGPGIDSMRQRWWLMGGDTDFK